MAGILQTTVGAVGRFTRYQFQWTCDASGNATLTLPAINGTICKVEFNPTGTPTAAYVVTITDSAGVDILAGQGAAGIALSASVPTQLVPSVPMKDGTTTSTAPCVVAEALTLNISAAGNVKSGQVILYVAL